MADATRALIASSGDRRDGDDRRRLTDVATADRGQRPAIKRRPSARSPARSCSFVADRLCSTIISRGFTIAELN